MNTYDAVFNSVQNHNLKLRLSSNLNTFFYFDGYDFNIVVKGVYTHSFTIPEYPCITVITNSIEGFLQYPDSQYDWTILSNKI